MRLVVMGPFFTTLCESDYPVMVNPSHTWLQLPESAPPEQPEYHSIEVVSVTEEDLPNVETPTTLNVSPLGSPPDSPVPPAAEEVQPGAPASPTMPITKVQPFMNGEAKTPSRPYAMEQNAGTPSCVTNVV